MSAPAYRIEARVKNNRLWQALRRTFPGLTTQVEMAREIGIGQQTLNQYLTMRLNPALAITRNGRHASGRPWAKPALMIAEAVGETPDYLFDPALYGRGASTFALELTPAQLQTSGLVALPPAPDDDARERNERVEHALATLTPQERDVLERRFGLHDGHDHTLLEVGDAMARTPERIRQIEVKALRKLRHPSRLTRLREFR